MNSYLILGHGIETLVNFEERKRIPEGITLVTIAVCGVITTKDEVCPMVEAFTKPENKEILEHPRIYKKKIQTDFLNGKDIHIYTQGDLYPNLMLQMFLDWKVPPSKKGEQGYTEIFKSGMYRFPESSETFLISKEEGTFCDKCFLKLKPYRGWQEALPEDYSADIMFSGSLLPTPEQVEEKIFELGPKSEPIKASLRYPLEAMFARGGPGVYYYVVCRAFHESKSPKNLINENLLPNPNGRYNRFFKKNWLENVSEFAPMVEENLPKLSSWQQNIVRNQLKIYKNLVKVPTLRRKSILQQGEGRKTKRKERKERKQRKQRKQKGKKTHKQRRHKL